MAAPCRTCRHWLPDDAPASASFGVCRRLAGVMIERRAGGLKSRAVFLNPSFSGPAMPVLTPAGLGCGFHEEGAA